MPLFFPRATQFIGLTDVPSSYSGAAGQVATVNGTENGLEFAAAGGSGGIIDRALMYWGSKSQTITNNTNTEVDFGSAVVTAYDTAGWKTGNTFVVDADGLYQPFGSVTWQDNATGMREVKIYLNGNAYNGGPRDQFAPTETGFFRHSVAGPLVSLTTGDIISLYVRHTAGTNLSLSGSGGSTYLGLLRWA